MRLRRPVTVTRRPTAATFRRTVATSRRTATARTGTPGRTATGPRTIPASATGCTAAQLRRFIKSRAYVPMHELRRRFELIGDADDVSPVDTPQGPIYLGLPPRESRLIGELVRQGEVGVELCRDPRVPIVVGVYPDEAHHPPVTRSPGPCRRGALPLWIRGDVDFPRSETEIGRPPGHPVRDRPPVDRRVSHADRAAAAGELRVLLTDDGLGRPRARLRLDDRCGSGGAPARGRSLSLGQRWPRPSTTTKPSNEHDRPQDQRAGPPGRDAAGRTMRVSPPAGGEVSIRRHGLPRYTMWWIVLMFRLIGVTDRLPARD